METNRLLNRLTHNRSLWLLKLHEQRYDLGLPLPHCILQASLLIDTPTPQLEKICTTVDKVDRSWLLPHSKDVDPQKQKLRPSFSHSIISLEAFLDRWLLCIYYNGTVTLWDMSDPGVRGQHGEGPNIERYSAGRLYTKYSVSGFISSCVYALEKDEQSILVACTDIDGCVYTLSIMSRSTLRRLQTSM